MNVEKIEPQTPWSNYFEGAIRDLKKGTGLEILCSGASKMIWDDCLKQEALIRSHTAHDIYGINCKVPETIASGETADIYPHDFFAWYEWVIYRDTYVP